MATKGVHIRITESGATTVARGLTRVDRGLSGISRNGQRVTSALAKGFGGLTRSLGSLSTQAGALGLALGGRAVLAFDDKLGQIQADAKLTTADAMKLRDQILALQTSFKVSKDEIAGAVQVFQDFGGRVKEGVSLLPFLTKVSKATGTGMRELATISGGLIDTLGKSPTEVRDIIGQLNQMALAGTISMKDMARAIPGLSTAANNAGISLQEMFASLQVVGASTGGDVDVARTSLLALMSQLQQNSKKLKKDLGVEVFKIDPATGKETMRSLESVMSEVFKKTGGKLSGKTGLLSFFNLESKKALDAFLASYDSKTGQLAGKFRQVVDAASGGGQTAIDDQLKRRTEGIAAESEKVKGALFGLEESFQKAAKNVLGWASQNPGAAVATGVGALLAKSFGPAIWRWLRSGKGAGAAGGLAGALGSKPIPVYVVNGPGGLGGATGSAGGALGGLGGKLGKAAGSVAAVAGALTAGYAVGTFIDKQFGLSTKISDAALRMTGNDSAGAKRRADAHGQAGIRQRLSDQAATLLSLSRRGVGSFGAAGAKKSLTAENVMAHLQASASRQGASAGTWAAMVPILQSMLAEMKKPPVVIQQGGIDHPRVAGGRG